MQEQPTLEITAAEWEIMRVIWTLGQASSKEIIDIMAVKQGWKVSTVKTLLGRLVKKEVLHVEQNGRSFLYQATINEDDAMFATLNSTFNQFCAMKNGRTLAKVLKTLDLSQADIEQLQQTLAAKATTAPTMVACDCIPAECEC